MPAVDAVAADYDDEVAFVAVAGRSDLDRTAQAADALFGPPVVWGLGDDVWQAYGVAAQPFTVLITPDGVVAEQWFGAIGEDAIRAQLDGLLAELG